METTHVTKTYDASPMEFDLTALEVEVTIGGEKYILVELNGKGRDAYLNGLSNRMRTTPTGQPSGIKNFDGLHADLISRCLFKIGEDGGRTQVKPETIQGWPARVAAGLFDRAKEISGLGEDAEEKAKND